MSRRFTGGTLSSGILYINGGYLSSATVPVTGFPFTMACWASAADATNFNPIMAFSDELIANDAIILSIDGELVQLRYIQGGMAGVLSTAAVDGTGYYIALVCTSATDKKLYVNGTLVGTVTTNLTFPATFDRYYVGAEYRSTRFTAHDATVALPVVWNVALTEAEVKRLAAGVYPESVRGSSIVAFHGLFRACSPEPDISGGTNDLTVAGTGTSATGASGPTIDYSSPIIYPIGGDFGGFGMPANGPAFARANGTVSSSALALTDAPFSFTADQIARANRAVITANSTAMVIQYTGDNPTTTSGIVIPANMSYPVEGSYNVGKVKIIAQGGAGTVTVTLHA